MRRRPVLTGENERIYLFTTLKWSFLHRMLLRRALKGVKQGEIKSTRLIIVVVFILGPLFKVISCK